MKAKITTRKQNDTKWKNIFLIQILVIRPIHNNDNNNQNDLMHKFTVTTAKNRTLYKNRQQKSFRNNGFYFH